MPLTTSDHIAREAEKLRSEGKFVVAMQECATGNGEVGTMWTETAVFGMDTPLSEVLAWSQVMGGQSPGRLTISVDAKNGR